MFLTACETNELGFLSARSIGSLPVGPAPRGDYKQHMRAACGDGHMTPVGQHAIVRTPYLQKTTDTSVVVMWTTIDPGDARVVVTRPDGTVVTEVASIVEDTTALRDADQRLAAIDGLAPDTTYCYHIASSTGAPMTERIGLRTAPSPTDTGEVRFITMGDLGMRSIDQYAVLEQLQTVDFDFALINGDVAYNDGTLREFETNFFDVYKDVTRSFPFFIASGNHDYKTRDGAVCREVFDLFGNGVPGAHERWYSYDWGPLHVVVLDTEQISDEQAAWLDADLAGTDRPWTIVTMHRPAYSSGHHGSDQDVRDMFGPIIRKYKVPLVLAGHDHNYERSVEIDGTHYIVSGAGGRGTRPVGRSSFTAFSEQVSHFVYVVADDQRMTAWAIDATGVDFDSVVIERN